MNLEAVFKHEVNREVSSKMNKQTKKYRHKKNEKAIKP